MNKFSIIIPVYNCEKYIIDCLNSINIQKSDNYEAIIIDDGSTDNSNTIIKEYIKDKKQFHLYTNKNHGVSYSRNFGIEKAKNDYIIFLDSDDMLDRNALSTYENIIKEHTDFDLIQCGYKEFSTEIVESDEIDENIITITDNEIDKLRINLITDKSISYGSSVIPAPFCKVFKRKNILDNKIKFNQKFNIFEDGIFSFEYLFTCSKVYFSKSITYHYRITQGASLSKKSDAGIIDQKIEQCKYIHDIIKNNYMNELYYHLFIFSSISSVLYRYVYNPKNNFSLTEKKKLILEILDKEEFKTIKNKKIMRYLSLKKKVLYSCIKLRLFLLLNFLYSMREH